MLTFLSLLWGIFAIIGLGLSFIPYVASWNWVNIPFDVIGTCVGIGAIFSRKEGGSRWAMVGIALCMAASIVAMLRLVAVEAPS